MLTRLVKRSESVSEGSIEYEDEYRKAEYEYEEMSESCDAQQTDRKTLDLKAHSAILQTSSTK